MESILKTMKEYVAEALGEDVSEIDENTSFFRIGISSVQALKIMNKLRKNLNIEVSPVAMFEYKCIAELAAYLYECKKEAA